MPHLLSSFLFSTAKSAGARAAEGATERGGRPLRIDFCTWFGKEEGGGEGEKERRREGGVNEQQN